MHPDKRYYSADFTPLEPHTPVNRRRSTTDIESSDTDVEMLIPNVKTFVRSNAPQELARSSSNTKSRGVTADMTLLSVVHCGGGLIKGNLILRHNAKSKKNKTTQVSKIQLDCLGVECMCYRDD